MSAARIDWQHWIARRRMQGLLLDGQGAGSAAAVVGSLTAMQAQEHGYARWSVAQRTDGSPTGADIDAAFDDGQILRTHVLRPTWHYVAPADLRWLIGLSGPRVDGAAARRYEELGLDASILNRSNEVIAGAVAGGPRTRRELATILEGHGISTQEQRASYLFMHAELAAVVCSGPMRGKQHTYAAFNQRVPVGKAIDVDEALAELAWRYFSTRGPATVRDFSWWAGIAIREGRRSLAMVQSRLASREIDSRIYWFAEGAAAPPTPSPTHLVQCYDEAIISFSESRDVLRTTFATFAVPGHIDGFHHVLLMDGRLLGQWRVIRGPGDVHIETRTSKPLESDEQLALADAADRYRRFIQPDAPGRT